MALRARKTLAAQQIVNGVPPQGGFQVPKSLVPKLSKAEFARRLAEPCLPNLDFSAVMAADDLLGDDRVSYEALLALFPR